MTGAPDRSAWREALRFGLLVFLGVRIGTFVLGLLATGLLPPRAYIDASVRTAPRAGGWEAILTAWERQDALWYLQIADLGYRQDDGSAAFFPLLPTLVRAVGFLIGDDYLLLSAMLVANLCFAAALVVVYALTAQEFDSGMAQRTTLLVAIYPYAFFFLAPYTESLFLLLSATTLWAIRHERWLVAGAVGALGSLTRSAGVLLAVVVLIAGVLAFRRTKSWRSIAGAVLAAGIILGGLALYLGYWHFRFGEALRPFTVQSRWDRSSTPPWETLTRAAQEAGDSPGAYHGGYDQLNLLLAVLALISLVWVARHTAYVYTCYVVLALLLPLTWPSAQSALLSLPRFLAVLFPLFWPVAKLAEREHVRNVIVAVSACGLGMSTMLFVTSYYIH